MLSELTVLMLLAAPATPPAPAFVAEPAAIASEGVTLQGEWLFPDAASKVPVVILAGGTMSQTRDGALEGVGPAGAQRDALGRLARQLAAAGYASLRWDKRGHGATPPGPQPVTNEHEAADLAAAIRLARVHARASAVIVAGESAGGYFACLAASHGVEADGYIFLGALASDGRRLFEYNYGQLRQWAEKSPANRAWCEAHCLEALAVGHGYEAMFEAAARGESTYVIEYAGRRFPRSLARIRTELAQPPAQLFRHIRRPALVLQGEADLNVPVGDHVAIERVLREAGNQEVTCLTISGTDHSFQYADADEAVRWRDRYAFTSFYRLYHPQLYREVARWLQARFPSPVSAVDYEEPRPGIARWSGIQVIDDVTDAAVSPGVETLEGRIGPLLKGAGSQAHYIDMPAGLYLHEHPHSTESLVYTVRGSWVLCSGGQRRLMKPGSLFWFAAGEPTGWEVPFEQPAYVLIFKGDRSDWSDARFWEYLGGLAAEIRAEQAAGEAFRFEALPPDHPARLFARQVNPTWEASLPAGR